MIISLPSPSSHPSNQASSKQQNSSYEPGCKPWQEDGAWHYDHLTNLENQMQINEGVLRRNCKAMSKFLRITAFKGDCIHSRPTPQKPKYSSKGQCG